jgi:hypothetical protein
MGTSGSYGGSNRAGWKGIRDIFDEMAADDLSTNTGPLGTGVATDEPYDHLEQIGNMLFDILSQEDQDLQRPLPTQSSLPLSSLLPKPTKSAHANRKTESGEVVIRALSSSPGRSGSRSKRQIVRSIGRGGAAIGGAFALRREDEKSLRELGLDLSELRSLSPKQQCAVILDKILGEGAHPDEYVLREAAAEQIKKIVLNATPPKEFDAIRNFISSFVFKICKLEIRSGLTASKFDTNTAANKEKRIRRWIERRIRQIKLPDSGSLPIQSFHLIATQVIHEATQIIKA